MDIVIQNLASSDNNVRYQAENQIMANYENDDFILNLIEMYYNFDQNLYLKTQILNLILDLSKMIFSLKSTLNNKNFNKQVYKIKYIENLLNLCNSIPRNHRKIYENILVTLFKYNFPIFYECFEKFIFNNLKFVQEKNDLSYNEFDNLRTTSKLFKSVRDKKNNNENIKNLIENNNFLIELIENKFNLLQNNFNDINLKILKYVVSIVHSTLYLSNNYNSNINLIISKIINILKYVYDKIITQNVDINNFLITLINDLSQLTFNHSIYLIESLDMLIEFFLNLIFIENINELVKKTILVFLLRILQSRVYYNNDSNKLINKKDLYFFNNNMYYINSFKIFSDYILNKNLWFKLVNEFNNIKYFKDIVEINEFIDKNDISTKIEINNKLFEIKYYELSKLNYVFISNLFNKFPECFDSFEYLVKQIVNTELDQINNDFLICNYFKIFNIYPKIYSEYNNRNIQISKMNIYDLLKYLENNYYITKNNMYLTTVINLLKSWHDYFDDNFKMNIMPKSIEWFNLNDPFLNYEILHLISIFYKNNLSLNFNLSFLIENLLPKFCDLISLINIPEVLISLINFIKLIFEKNNEIIDISVFQNLDKLDLAYLIENNKSMFLNYYSELLMNILVFLLRQNSNILVIENNILNFLKISLEYMNEENAYYLIDLFLILCKNNLNWNPDYFQYFDIIFQKFHYDDDPKVCFIILSLLEEFILNNFENVNSHYTYENIFKYVDSLLMKLYKYTYEDSDYYPCLSALLSIYSTLLLKLLKNNIYQFNYFSNFYNLIIIDINENINNLNKKLIHIKNQSITLFCRLIWIDFNNIISILKQDENKMYGFLANLFLNIRFISSSNCKKICFILWIQLLEVIDNNFIINNFEILTYILIDAIESNFKNIINNHALDLKKSGKYSYRKEELRTNYLYNDVNIMDLFKKTFLIYFQKMKNENITLIQNEELLNKFILIFNN